MATNVRFSSLLTMVNEDNNQHGSSYHLALERDGDLAVETKVYLKAKGIRSKAATRNEDYMLAEGPIVFAPEEKVQPISKALAVLPDDIEEGTEKIVLIIEHIEGGQSAEPSEATVLVVDKPQPVAV